jgi:hypothetical protein
MYLLIVHLLNPGVFTPTTMSSEGWARVDNERTARDQEENLVHGDFLGCGRAARTVRVGPIRSSIHTARPLARGAAGLH